MDKTHLHLLITHLPIYGSLMGIIVLVYGLISKSYHTKNAAYVVFIVAALGGLTAYLSGGFAAHTVKNIAEADHKMIHKHAEFATITLYSMLFLAGASILSLFLTARQSVSAKSVGFVMLILSLISFGLAARTGYLGGQIRHTEINSPPAAHAESGPDQD